MKWDEEQSMKHRRVKVTEEEEEEEEEGRKSRSEKKIGEKRFKNAKSN